MKIKIPKPELIPIFKLRRNAKNVKLHPKEQIHDLMELMKMVGFKDPIVIDKEYNIWAGHGRLDAAEQLNMKEAPCIYLENLNEDQKKVFMLMDNKISESAWVKENIKLIFDEIDPISFSPFQMTFEDFGVFDKTLREEKTEIPEPPETPVTIPGDIYELGNHRVMCGSSTSPDDMKSLLNGAKINCLQTDPPYGIDYASKNEFLNEIDRGNRIQTGLRNDTVIMDYRKFIGDFLKNIEFADYNTVYIWMSDIRYFEVRQAMLDSDIRYCQNLTWVKNNHVLSRLDYQPKQETCIYGWHKKHRFHGGNTRQSVLEYDKPHVSDLHPTMKPLPMIRQLITDGSLPGETVLDGFLGSGTTLIACEQTGRVCYGMELDPHYIDVIVQRWENFTGKKALKVNELIKTVS